MADAPRVPFMIQTSKIQVTARHSFTTDALQHYIEEKLGSIALEFPKVIHAHVILDVQKFRHVCEMLLRCNGRRHCEAREESEDMYASIDACVDKLARQLEKQKGKEIRRRKPERRLSELSLAE
jgi:putative sigma-54 modulation protein